MKYATPEAIKQYLSWHKGFTGTPEELIDLANWFAEGAVTTLSNYLYDHLRSGARLEHNLAEGCRCGSCFEFQLLDEDEVVASTETLSDWVKEET